MLQLTKQKPRILPKRGHQPDKYQGQLDPLTKLRNGTGQYLYDNPFFAYQGHYLQGRKQGNGTLLLKNHSQIHATFQQDELIGPSQIRYSHGATYKGNLELGQKSGHGVYQSQFQTYEGEWKDNNKHGNGTYKNLTTNEEYAGQWQASKYHGTGKLTRWNYLYEGEFINGLKEGEGKEVNDWPREGEEGIGRYQYTGSFKNDKFEGTGQFKSKENQYVYQGQFQKGMPLLYPNEFRLWLTTNTKAGQEITQGEKTLISSTQPLDYQLQGDSLNFYIDTVYQGPEILDEVQPTQQQIDALIKNWQNQNKKNKSPPPMPDFTQPRMKKPQVLVVSQQTGRTITLRLHKEVEGKQDYLKIDYRTEIVAKRKQNEELRQEALKKAQEDAGKKGGKKDNKQPQLKVNLYKQKPTKKQTSINIFTTQGKSQLKIFQLPDDFPPGKYYLTITTPCKDFGPLPPLRKQLNIKSKAPPKKK